MQWHFKLFYKRIRHDSTPQFIRVRMDTFSYLHALPVTAMVKIFLWQITSMIHCSCGISTSPCTHLKLVLWASNTGLLLLPKFLRLDNICHVNFTWKTFLHTKKQFVFFAQRYNIRSEINYNETKADVIKIKYLLQYIQHWLKWYP